MPTTGEHAARDFATAVHPASVAIATYAAHVNRLTSTPGGSTPAGSIAADESAQEAQLSEETWPEPVRTAHMHAGMLMYFLVDHVQALAALMAVGPVYAQWAMLRPIIDVAAVAAWINEPNITAEIRVRRSLSLERQSLHYERSLPHKRMVQRALAKEKRINDYERTRGWGKGQREKVPVAGTDFIKATFSKDDPTFSLTLWKMASGTAHGDSWALAQAVHSFASQVVDRTPIASIGISSDEIIRAAGIGVLALNPGAYARVQFLGRKPDDAFIAAWDQVTAQVTPHFVRPPSAEAQPVPPSAELPVQPEPTG